MTLEIICPMKTLVTNCTLVIMPCWLMWFIDVFAGKDRELPPVSGSLYGACGIKKANALGTDMQVSSSLGYYSHFISWVKQ